MSNPSADRFHAIIDSLTEGLWVTDSTHRLVYANPSLARLLGCGVEQLLGTPVPDGLPAGGSRFFRDAYQAALADGRARPYRCRAIVGDGRMTWLRGWLTPQRQNGVFSGMVGTVGADDGQRLFAETRRFLASCADLPAGEPRFRAAARHLAESLAQPHVCISRCDAGGGHGQPLVYWCVDRFVDAAASPMADAARCRELGLGSRLEHPLYSHQGLLLGRITLLGEAPPADRGAAEQTLWLVAGRLAAELERRDAEAAGRAAEQRLRRSEEDLRLLVDGSPAGQLLVEPESLCVVACNLTGAAMLGRRQEEVLGCRLGDVDSGLKRKALAALRRQVADAGRRGGKTRIHRCDGRLRNLDLRLILLHASKGARLHVALQDRADRKQAAAEQATAQYQRALLDNFPFMVWLKDERSRFLAVNRVMAEAFGYASPESLIGCDDEAIAPADLAEIYRSSDRAVMRGGRGQQLEEQVERGGERRWFEVHKSPLVIAGRLVGTVGFARDITERKQAEAELLAAKSDAERANRAKSRFLAAASHDLRQPLSALELYIGVLQQRVAPDCQDLVANIRNCLGSLSDLLAKLLDVSKLDAGVVTPKRSDFAIDALLGGLLSVHAAEADLQGLRLRWRQSGAVVYTDPVLLRRIVGNFLANAIRYTERGGVLVACRRRRGKWWLEVWDSGIGIPADKCEAIFEEFNQLGDASRRRGSGLGLAIVAKTAHLLDLEIRVCSRPERGSLFAIELPPGRVAGVAATAPTAVGARSVRIGLVEDHGELRQALTCALGNAGHTVVAAASGTGLLALLDGQAPAVVISDYRLGGQENGFAVIEMLRQRFGDGLPALLITGDTDPALVRSMADRGIPVCYKPLQVEALLAFIAEATERRAR